MNSSLPSHLQTIVETICEQGCREVNMIIDDIENGGSHPMMEKLSAQEQHQVLRELQSIMAVYTSCGL